MMKYFKLFTTICGLFFAATSANAYTERNLLEKKASVSELKQVLVTDQQWVPYPAYADREGWDRLLGNNKDRLILLGEERLDYQWRLVKASDYIEYERSGSRDIMQNPFNENNRTISELLFAELAEGKGRFIDQIINGVFYYCEMTSWALSAHLSVQHSRRSLPDYKDNIIDLTVGEVGAMLAWTHYFLCREFDRQNPVIAERLRAEIQKRILQPYLTEDRFWWMALNLQPGGMVNNWNPWCNFNVLQCFLLLENDPDKLARAVSRTMISVDRFINYTKSDGACEEGPSYWGHAAGKLYDYLQLLSDASEGKISIFNQPIIKNMGEYISRSYVGDGWVVNFADASAKGGGEASLIYRYGKAISSSEMISYAAHLYHRDGTAEKKRSALRFGTDLFRGLQSLLYNKELETVKLEYQTPLATWYPETQFCYMKTASGFFLATKGGHNNESHNHNDAGTFSLYLNSVPVLIDAGVGTYTRQTFSAERYTIWTMCSDYHNLPMINGVSQQFGARYKATDVRFDPKSRTFSADLATAYPEQAAVEKWIRSYTLKNNQLLINDHFQLRELKEKNQIHFLTWGKVDISVPGKISIRVRDQKISLDYDPKIFSPFIETIPLDDSRLSNVWGKEIYRIVLQAKTGSKTGNYGFRIRN